MEYLKTNTYRTIRLGDNIVLLNDIANGKINIPAGGKGRIINCPNQVNPVIWFYEVGTFYNDPITRVLEANISGRRSGKLHGLSIEVDSQDFAIVYNHEEHASILKDEEKFSNVEFFELGSRFSKLTRSRKNVGNGTMNQVMEISVGDAANIISDRFSEWVKENMTYRKATEDDFVPDYSIETVLDEESNELFQQKKTKLEMDFAKATGIYIEFNGGLLVW